MMEHFHNAQQQISDASHTVVHSWTGKLLVISAVMGAMKFATIEMLTGWAYSVLGCISLLMIMVINYPRFKKRIKEIWANYKK